MKNKDKTPKFIALAVVCLLVGAGIGLVSYHYFLKPQLAVYEELTQNHTTTNVMKIEPTKEMVERIVLYEDGPQEVIDPKTKKGIAIASLLTCKLHELNLQATCVFSEEDIYEMKKGRIGRRMDRMIELVLKNPIDIVISRWVEPEERYRIPVDEKGYRILENVKTALFILEDKGGGGLESHILVGHLIPPEPGLYPGKEIIGYSCWAIQQEGSTELDKNWIKQIEKTLTLEEFCGWSTYGNCSSDSDCTAGGCSGQVCQSKYEEPVITTCEWRDCFDASKYGLKCRCIDGRCQWSEIEPAKEVPTMTGISHLTPQPGEYFIYRGNKSKILLNDSRLKYCFLELNDICPPDAANIGDPGIVITGTIKNEYDRDYYICMAAHAFNSEWEQIGGSIDRGPVCGVIAPYVKSGKTRDFELHLKYREDIERIELSVGCVSEIPPP